MAPRQDASVVAVIARRNACEMPVSATSPTWSEPRSTVVLGVTASSSSATLPEARMVLVRPAAEKAVRSAWATTLSAGHAMAVVL
jgi:hypothetical protein